MEQEGLAVAGEAPTRTSSKSVGRPLLGNEKSPQQPVIRSSRGKQPQWRDLDTLAAVRATVRLPDASINGSKQKRVHWHSELKVEFDRFFGVLMVTYPELNDRHKMDVWKSRSGRSVAEQGQKSLAICRKLRGCLRLVEAHRFTGNPTETDRIRCAVGLYNNVIKVSHFYDVFMNPNYIIRNPFPFPRTFEWLNKETTELDPVPVETDEIARCDTVVLGAGGEGNDGKNDGVGGRNVDEKEEQSQRQTTARKRPLGVKAAKSAKKAKKEEVKEDTVLQTALESWKKGFAEASSASIEAANSRTKASKEHSDRNYVLRKEADELEAVRVLFNDDDEESKTYRKALKKKRLRKL